MEKYDLDFFTALSGVGTILVTINSISDYIFLNKLRGVNELLHAVSLTLEKTFLKRLRVDPLKISTIDIRIESLKKEAQLLKENIRS